MIFNDIKWFPGGRLGGFCTAWLRVLDFVLRQKALEVFLVSNGILWLVWLLLATWMRHWMMQWTWRSHVHWVSDVIQPSHPLSSPCHPAFNLSQIQSLFKWVSSSYQVAKVLEFQLRHQSFQWIFRTDLLGWTGWISLQPKGLLKSLLQHHHSSKASILWCSASFIVQLSHPYVTTGKTIALTRQTFVDKVMSLLFNILSRLVITFLPGSKCLLISWLQ